VVTGAVNNNSNKIHSKERSILSVVFFGNELQIQEQQNFGGHVHNQKHIELGAPSNSVDYFNNISTFFKNDISSNWHKAFALIPAENHLLIPNIFYQEDKREQLFEQSHLEHSGEIKSCKPVNTNSTLLYSCGHNLEMFLHNNFPGIEIYSDVHWLINHCMLSSNANNILVLFDEGKLKVVIKKEGALQIVNAFKAENTDEMVYYLGYVINAVWPNNAQNMPITLHANENRLDLNFIKKYFPNTELISTVKQSTMLQLLSECV
jgi:hypothetical protein